MISRSTALYIVSLMALVVALVLFAQYAVRARDEREAAAAEAEASAGETPQAEPQKGA